MKYINQNNNNNKKKKTKKKTQNKTKNIEKIKVHIGTRTRDALEIKQSVISSDVLYRLSHSYIHLKVNIISIHLQKCFM